MSQRRLLYVMHVSNMYFVRYGFLKDVFCTLWMSQRRALFVIGVFKTYFARYGYLKDLISADRSE